MRNRGWLAKSITAAANPSSIDTGKIGRSARLFNGLDAVSNRRFPFYEPIGASAEIAVSQQDLSLACLETVTLVRFLLDRRTPAVESREASLLAVAAGAEMFDERFHRDGASDRDARLRLVLCDEINDVPSYVPAAD